ncbi:hypothetical protein CONPUDRAFT_168344 [Coniophora puteana RWD-64-598 SS2]|uniref:DUF6534 domain-containing protein n=1 Tax=Coniophora puteana (strain RWD-64-598) TaxID=741705 RepID=A0A5M3MF35_CONPW|nr:uncharacterized protein CONPUDRAFT_168344 [Coniophora puteana RWD-64-598 SS2]EIW77414.1 hypothetical protein CONPUDRAFT_168344 [Coniophora puteana RWD-64-598 SS2]
MATNTNLLFGPLLIGVFLNCILYGVAVVQAFMYFQNFKRDTLWIKCFVLYLIVVETINAACDIGLIYEPLVLRWGDERATIVSPIMLPSDAIVTVVISTPVQLFLAWRVKVMSNSSIVPIIIGFLAIISLLGGFATGITVSFINEYAEFHRFEGAPTSWLLASAAADVLITASLVWNLYRRKSGIRVTDDVVNRIIRLTVQTGLVTAAAAIADAIIFVASTTTINYLFDFPLSKLYTNSVLSTLNARGRWRSMSRPRGDEWINL